MEEIEKSLKKECCLCGDVGFSGDLRLCPNCGFRLQHTYCSSSYPNIEPKTWLCEWCLHDQLKKRAQDPTKRSKALDFLLHIAHSLPDSNEDHHHHPPHSKSRRRKDKDDDRPPKPTTLSPAASKRPKSGDERWRKLNCNSPSSSSSPRGIGRRYKLLADVLC